MRACGRTLSIFATAGFLFFLGPQMVSADLQDDLSLGYSLVDQWRLDEADAYVSSLLKKYGDSGDVHFLWGRLEFFIGNYLKDQEILKDV